MEYFNNYYIMMQVTAFICFMFFFYSFSLLFPNKTIDVVPASVQIIVIILGVLILSAFGSLMLFQSQILTSNCMVGKGFLDSATSKAIAFGENDEEWLQTCVNRRGSGNILSFLNKKEKEEFGGLIQVLIGLSINYDTFRNMSGHEGQEMKKLRIKIQQLLAYNFSGTSVLKDHNFLRVK